MDYNKPPPAYSGPGYVDTGVPQQFPGYVNTGVPQQQGYAQPPFPGYVQTTPATNVVVVQGGGSCPHCHVGYPREDYPCCAICLAIWFFPIGILCCLAMKERTCSNCGRNI